MRLHFCKYIYGNITGVLSNHNFGFKGEVRLEKIVIRKANIEDLSAIQALNNELFDLELQNYDPTLVKDWPLTNEGKEYFEDLIANHYVSVAIQAEEVVGYLAGSINQKGSYETIQYGEINNMFIRDTVRGLGIGSNLINEFKAYCKKNGIDNLMVTASANNIDAISFYKKNGFDDFNLMLTMNITKEANE